MSSKNLEVAKRCFLEFKFRAAISHFSNAFLSSKNMWIIHPEPTISEQKRIFNAYQKTTKIKKIIINLFTRLIWFKSPERLHRERLIYFKN